MTTKEMKFTNMNIKDFIDYIITFDIFTNSNFNHLIGNSNNAKLRKF